MRVQDFLPLFILIVLSPQGIADFHPVEQTEVVTLDELSRRSARFSESNPDDANAMKALGQAWLASYLTGRKYFVLDILPERVPPWSLRDSPLIPLHDDYVSGRRSGDGTVELENALQSLNEALTRAPDNQDVKVLVAYACLVARRHETITGVSLQGRPETAEFDGASPDVDLWEQRALRLCRTTIDNESVEHSRGQVDPGSYACSILHYLFEHSNVKPRSDEERYLAAGGKEHYDFMKDRFDIPVEATFKPSPTDLVALNALYPDIPRQQNGAMVYLDAMDAVVEDQEFSEELDITGFLVTLNPDAMPENFEARADELLKANSTCLELMEKASSHRAWRYPVDFERDWDFVSAFQIGGGERRLPELLHIRAAQGILKGRYGPAIDSVRDLAALANSVRNEPLIISQLMRMALVTRTIQILELLVSRVALNDALREEIQRVLISLENFQGVQAIWQVERMSIDHPVVEESINDPSIGLEYTDLTPEQREKSLERIRSERVARMALLDRILATKSWESFYAEVLAQREIEMIQRRLFLAFLSGNAHLRAAITALAIERFHAQHGEYPADLSALAPEFLDEHFLVDPFSGEPLQWRTTENGFLVHSAGDPDDVARRMERAALMEDGQDPLRTLTFTVERFPE